MFCFDYRNKTNDQPMQPLENFTTSLGISPFCPPRLHDPLLQKHFEGFTELIRSPPHLRSFLVVSFSVSPNQSNVTGEAHHALPVPSSVDTSHRKSNIFTETCVLLLNQSRTIKNRIPEQGPLLKSVILCLLDSFQARKKQLKKLQK